MTDRPRLTRRRLLTYGGAASATALTGPLISSNALAAGEPQVPRRTLGKTKQSIPILLVGGGAGFEGSFDARIAVALRHGVDYIDTARKYVNGKSEVHAARTLHKLKKMDKTWITSKSPHWEGKGFAKDVDATRDAMRIDTVDLYFLHGLDSLDPLNDEDLVKTTERLKKQKKIRFFGFSCHDGNVAELLEAAAKRPFVDAVMFRYNFRQYGDEKLNRAIDAAHKAGVGLIAMKTQGSEAGIRDGWKKFEKTGKWNKYQAVLKAVWSDERITAAVSHMTDKQQLMENIAAAVDKHELGALDRDALERYAEATRPFACQGCDHVCGPAVDAPVRIGATLRYLMYHDAYGDTEQARALFRVLPEEARRYEQVDFTAAADVCPYGVDVGGLMERARRVLA